MPDVRRARPAVNIAGLLRRRLAHFLVQFARCVTGHTARSPGRAAAFGPSVAARHAAERRVSLFHLGWSVTAPEQLDTVINSLMKETEDRPEKIDMLAKV